jgi:hypothetical protein
VTDSLANGDTAPAAMAVCGGGNVDERRILEAALRAFPP